MYTGMIGIYTASEAREQRCGCEVFLLVCLTYSEALSSRAFIMRTSLCRSQFSCVRALLFHRSFHQSGVGYLSICMFILSYLFSVLGSRFIRVGEGIIYCFHPDGRRSLVCLFVCVGGILGSNHGGCHD